MMLWFLLALIMTAAIVPLLWALARPRAMRSGSDLAVYEDQLEEIGRDRLFGRIGDAEADAARVEISRRLLAADAAASAPSTEADPWPRRIALVGALLVVPIGSAGIYLALGSPSLTSAPPSVAQSEPPAAHQSIATLVTQVEAHLARNPEDGRGWEVLAPVYMEMGRFDQAVRAREAALRLLGETAERQADLGEALVAAAKNIVTPQAKAVFDRAHTLDPKEVTARFYLGLAAEQDGRHDEAGKIWRELLAEAPAGAKWIEFVRRALARLEGTTVAAVPGPSVANVETANKLAPDAQNEMIRGMVQRLADRLKQEGADVDGWARLLRSYIVLGERDRALAALADARRALASDPDKVQQLNATAKELGLDG